MVVVAYDISSEKSRGKLRRYLSRMGLSIVNRSVYAGIGGMRLAKRIAEKAEKVVEGNDNVFIIVVREEEFLGAYNVTSMGVKVVGEDRFEVL